MKKTKKDLQHGLLMDSVIEKTSNLHRLPVFVYNCEFTPLEREACIELFSALHTFICGRNRLPTVYRYKGRVYRFLWTGYGRPVLLNPDTREPLMTGRECYGLPSW